MNLVERSTRVPTADPLTADSLTDEMRSRLNKESLIVFVFAGTAREAAHHFPRSTNVAAGVAMALDGWDWSSAIVQADSLAALTSHVIEASSAAGQYRFDIRNEPDPNQSGNERGRCS